MGRDTWKNDVKTLFYIFNTFIVGVDLLFFSLRVGTGVLKGMKPWDILNLFRGLMYILFGALGYCCATMENKKILTAYTGLMVAWSISCVIELVKQSKLVAVAAADKGADGVLPEDLLLASPILITIITMVTTLLSFTLAAIAPKAADQEQGTRAMVQIKPSV